MSPLRVSFLTAVTLCVTVMSSRLLAPERVRLTSHNMDLWLRWNPPENETGDIVYSVQLWEQSKSEPRAACTNTSALHCELTDRALALQIFEFGHYHGSVRAQTASQCSPWANSLEITLDRDTVIGAPNVSLVSSGADLEVIMKEPEFHISTMAQVFGPVQYNISYWPRGHQSQVVHMLVEQNRAVLSDLEPMSEYCVQVQVHVSSARNQNPTDSSEKVCASTKDRPSEPWLAAVLTFVALALAVALVVVAVVCHKRIYHFLCPKDTLPQYPECPLPPSHLTQKEEVFHLLSVVPVHDTEEHIIPDGS